MASAKQIHIYVRGRKHAINKEKIGYREVVDLGYPDGKHGPLYEYNVSWKDGPRGREEGILNDNDFVKVVNEMRFDVKFTDRS